MTTSASSAAYGIEEPTAPPPGTAAPGQDRAAIQGRSPWYLAWRRLRQDRVAMISLVVIVLIILMAVFGGVSFITGIAFLLKGAWPVFGFFGLDVALLYIAFRLNYRSGRLYETVDLTVVRPSARHLIDGPADTVRAGIEAGMLATSPGDVRERVLMLLLGLYGVSLLAVPRPDVAELLVPRLTRLSRRPLASDVPDKLEP